ncbi:MAG TPA: XTP/dITP diphosphatase [Candidatus Acidoferrum sp.]|jgi:XTP/dITP diphosphohydrolase|nr:XTP/dITP diphosphatase [Candidatus Acidoferrum sp.]
MSLSSEGKVIIFATGNIHKFTEARSILAEYDIAVGMLRAKTLEIQSESLEEIAETSVIEAYRNCRLPIIVEDAGLFIQGLKGFPGSYAAYAYKTIGNKGVLKLMEGIDDRTAKFQSVIAYLSTGLKLPVCFVGEVTGEIVKEERASGNMSGFGFDPIFKPSTSQKTFAEMSLEMKNKHSHRARALRKFGEWYRKRH